MKESSLQFYPLIQKNKIQNITSRLYCHKIETSVPDAWEFPGEWAHTAHGFIEQDNLL